MAATADPKAWTTKSGFQATSSEDSRGSRVGFAAVFVFVRYFTHVRQTADTISGNIMSRIMNRSTIQATRKTRKSYTLSPESVAFLEKVSRVRRAASVSSVLDELIESVRQAQERDALEQAVTGYYSKLSDKDVKEQAQWGDFALGEFPREKHT